MCIICKNNININMTKIEISNCKNIKEIPQELINLEEIIIVKCDNFTKLYNTFTKLKVLHIHYYNKTKNIPENFNNLIDLQLEFCPINKQTIYCYSDDRQQIKNLIKYVNKI